VPRGEGVTQTDIREQRSSGPRSEEEEICRCPLVFLATPNVYFLQAGSFHNSHTKDFTLSAQALPPPP
jgi:hypothetical protein